MSKLTKAQLVDELTTLRAQYEVLLTKYEDLKGQAPARFTPRTPIQAVRLDRAAHQAATARFFAANPTAKFASSQQLAAYL